MIRARCVRRFGFWWARRWRTLLLVVGVLLLAATVIIGPYLAAARSTQSQQQVAALQQTVSGIRQLLGFVASVQNGSQAKAGRDATGWYIAEFQHICAATPRCVQVPLPPSLRPAK